MQEDQNYVFNVIIFIYSFEIEKMIDEQSIEWVKTRYPLLIIV